MCIRVAIRHGLEGLVDEIDAYERHILYTYPEL